MLRSWKIGRVFGIGIYIHSTFLLLVAFVLAAQWWKTAEPLQAVYSVGLLGVVFGFVVLHELGHALMARRFGIATRDITLYPIGGVARLERMPERPWEEFCIAVAGPAVNVALILLLAVPHYIVYDAKQFDPLQLHFLPVVMFWVNVTLLSFNMLPAFPMDGGRVLRAALSPALGRLRATEVAAAIGAVFAVLFVLAGVYLTDEVIPGLILVGIVVFVLGRLELGMVRYIEYQRRRKPVTVVPVDLCVLDAMPASSTDEVADLVLDPRTGLWVLAGRSVSARCVD